MYALQPTGYVLIDVVDRQNAALGIAIAGIRVCNEVRVNFMTAMVLMSQQTVVCHGRHHSGVGPINDRDVGEHIVLEHLTDKRRILIVAEAHLNHVLRYRHNRACAKRYVDGARVDEGERMEEGGVDGGGGREEGHGVSAIVVGAEGDVEHAAVEEEGASSGSGGGGWDGYNDTNRLATKLTTYSQKNLKNDR